MACWCCTPRSSSLPLHLGTLLPLLSQERHAIGLAIRREVARAYRRIAAKGGKPEGSSKLWQQVRWAGLGWAGLGGAVCSTTAAHHH